MDRAKAIRYLESMATDLTGACVAAQSDKVSEYIAQKIQAVDMAIAALREQEQREQGCEVCSHGKYLTAIFTDQNGRDRLMLFKFCPNCGRKMPED